MKKITTEIINIEMKSGLNGLFSKHGFAWWSNHEAGGGLYKDENVVFHACYGIDIWKDNDIFCFLSTIGYPKVENIANPILSKYGLFGKWEKDDIIRTFRPPFSQNYQMKEKISIQLKQDVAVAIEKFKLFFVEDALPYFEKWKDLNTVSEFLNDIPQLEVHKYMSMGVFKKAVIWKLCGNPRYEEYMNWFYNAILERYRKFPDGDINFKRTANAITELKEVLDKTAPIYY